ncbi:MAG: prepilin-type N-terminal cleavage/methylation domain-containing protein [Acidobacteria bacterium]|nr:prepilin-type N-terminal cleavage/methylation domain-containing protein [Acidobacteriota bacterium]MSO60892.1 prepilin-type N-terminal cleavage/methylation domain-containing protein [Acidobacteriota bacterium]
MTTGKVRLTTSARASACAKATADRSAVKKPDAIFCSSTAGFSLVELLVALTVCALLSGAIAAVAPQARAAFDSTPEVLDLLQRERTVVDVLTRALRSAARLTATRDDGTAGEAVPAIKLLEPDEDGARFHAFRVLAVVGLGRGVLDADQAGPFGSLRLQPGVNCPSSGEVCGFSKGVVAALVDADGRVDVFTIASTSKGANSLSPSRPLSRAYPRESAMFAVSADRYYLDEQADGSLTLARETAAGAVQPIVDNVPELSIEPWRPAGVIKRLDIAVRLGARSANPGRRIPDRIRHLSISLRNPS